MVNIIGLPIKGKETFGLLLGAMRRVKNKISKDYAGYAGQDNPDAWANFRMSEQIGISSFLGCLIRLGDKFIRIQNLAKNPKNDQVGETIRDTLFDLASYALIAICLFGETKEIDRKIETLKDWEK